MSADRIAELDAIARADQASPIEARKILVDEIERLRALKPDPDKPCPLCGTVEGGMRPFSAREA